jgi:Uma2 family endonuclease
MCGLSASIRPVPGTARTDRVDRLRLYGQHGAREYWIVEPEEAHVKVCAARWQGIYGPGERFTSAVLAGQEVGLMPVFGAQSA